MPCIEICTGYGVWRAIHSSNPDTIAAWLWEQISTMSGGLESDPDITVKMVPLWLPGNAAHPNGEPDWSADSRLMGEHPMRMYGADTPRKRAMILIETLQKMVDEFPE